MGKLLTNESDKSPEEVVRDFHKKQELRRNIFVAIALVAICVWLYNSGSSSQNNSAEQVLVEADTSWIPSEFNVYSDNPNVGWRWLKNKEYKCTLGDFCWGMMVVTKDGCKNSLYAEVSILDKNNVQIGYTNDTASQSLPMQQTKLVFNTFEDDADSARLSKISCY